MLIPQWLQLMPHNASADYKDVCKGLGITRHQLRARQRSGQFPEPDRFPVSGLNISQERSRWSKQALLPVFARSL